MIVKHVDLLRGIADPAKVIGKPDIVHVHGCWKYGVVKKAMKAYKEGARLVFTPHGGLEPWIVDERRMTEKLSKTLLWQKRLTECAYVVIAHGPIESANLQTLNWNPRIETIRNAVVTNSITPEAMERQTQDVYRKVMDSNTLELMDDDSLQLMAMMLKAGITGDQRWVTLAVPDAQTLIHQGMTNETWRKLLIYAKHENVKSLIDRGATILGMQKPDIDTDSIQSYLPTGYQLPKTKATHIVDILGEMNRSLPTLYHLTMLDKALRRDHVEDDQLMHTIEEKGLTKYFCRILQLLQEQTLIDDGFLPAIPLDDRQTQTLRNLLYNHLKI
jgi:hypothetical protein